MAVDSVWTGTVDGSWATGGNWSLGVPGAATNAYFDNASASNKAITLPGSGTANQLTTTAGGFSLTSGTLTLLDQLYVYGSSASLSLTGGARVNVPSSSIGVGGGDSGNSLFVGSALAVANTLNVGYDGTGNTLQVTSSGSVTANAVLVGGVSTATASAVTVAAGGTVAANQIVVGYAGNANTFTNSGFVSSADTTVGFDVSAGGNTLSILAGGTWSNPGSLLVGASGTGNRVEVSGGTLSVTGSASDVIVGDAATARGNSLAIDGGSFSSQAALVIGRSGTGNSFSVTNGGTVSSNNVRIGLNAGSTGNVATVDGATSTWTMTGKLRVGSSGDGNALDIVDGGQVTVASDIFVGGTSTGSSVSNNAITVRGTGSTLTIQSGTADLVISFGTGTNNRVTVADGGTLAVSSVKLGPGGTLAIGSGSAAGTVSPGAAIDAPFGGGRLDFNHTDANYQFANPITGSVSVVQRGPGKTVITGTANSYTGNTTVAAGTLAVTGAVSPIATSGTVDVAAGAVLDVGGVTGFALGGSQTLVGSGTVSGAVQAVAGSIIAPGGAGLGTLAFDSSLAVFGTLKLDVSGTSADSISVAGPLTLDPASVLDFTVGAPLADQAFTLALYSTLSGTFGSLASLPSGYTVDYNYLGGNAVALVPVPEPTTLALLAAGGCCAVAAIRRRRSV